jgi:hypothetical protein
MNNFQNKNVMRKKKSHPVADQFSDKNMEQIKRYGKALSSGVTPFDEEVERYLARYEANRKNMEAAKAAQSAQNAPPPPRALR